MTIAKLRPRASGQRIDGLAAVVTRGFVERGLVASERGTVSLTPAGLEIAYVPAISGSEDLRAAAHACSNRRKPVLDVIYEAAGPIRRDAVA